MLIQGLLVGAIGGIFAYTCKIVYEANKSDDEVRDVAKNIQDTGIDFVCTGHCTKERAYGIMKEELGDKLLQLKVGLRMKF